MDANFSVARIVLLTYIIIASNYCKDLFSNSLRQAIEQNRMVQHLILIILIMALLIVFGNPLGLEFTNDNTLNTIILTLLIYAWFIMTTKLDLAWNVAVLVLLTIYFLYENRQVQKYKSVLEDPSLDLFKKKEIVDSYKQLQKYLILGIFGVTLIGTFFYAQEKQEQYGPGILIQTGGGEIIQEGGFSMYKFFFY